jgi:hypothetical protein
MTEKTVRRQSVSRRTLLSGTAGLLGGATSHRAGNSSYPIFWNALKRLAARYSPSEKAMLFGGTAKRVYRLA